LFSFRDEKKVICNKFAQSSSCVALIWPSESKLIIGLLDGKVRQASTNSNKCSTLYKAADGASVCAIAQQFALNILKFLFIILVQTKDHFYLVMKMVQCFCIHLIRDLMFDFLTKFWLCLAYTDTRLTRHTLPFGTGVSGSGFAGVEPSEL